MYFTFWQVFVTSFWLHSACCHLTVIAPRVGLGCVLCPRIDPLRFLAGCRRRRLNQGLVVALGFFSLLDRACFCVIFIGLWVHALFSSLSFCYQYQCNWLPGRFVPEMFYYVSTGTLNLTKLKLKLNSRRRLQSSSLICHTQLSTVSNSVFLVAGRP